jgi:PhnB protein
MAKPVKAIPECLHSLTPHIVVKDAPKLIEFYKRAFGATEKYRMTMPDGGIGHAELQIGDSVLFLSDEFPQSATRAPASIGGTSMALHLYVQDADAVFRQAVQAGATIKSPMADMFWGDRYGQVADPSGHLWSIATHREDLTPEEMKKREQQWLASMQQA